MFVCLFVCLFVYLSVCFLDPHHHYATHSRNVESPMNGAQDRGAVHWPWDLGWSKKTVGIRMCAVAYAHIRPKRPGAVFPGVVANVKWLLQGWTTIEAWPGKRLPRARQVVPRRTQAFCRASAHSGVCPRRQWQAPRALQPTSCGACRKTAT